MLSQKAHERMTEPVGAEAPVVSLSLLLRDPSLSAVSRVSCDIHI